MRKIRFIDCVAGNGKTTRAVRECASRNGEKILYVCYQKYDRMDVIEKLEREGFELQSSPLRGVSKLEHPETQTEVHVANIHAIGAYVLSQENERKSIKAIDDDRKFWKKYMKEYPRNFSDLEGIANPKHIGDVLFSIRNYMLHKFGEVVDLSEMKNDEDGRVILESLRMQRCTVSDSMLRKFLRDLHERIAVYENDENRRRKKTKEIYVCTYADMLLALDRFSRVYDLVVLDESQDQAPVGIEKLLGSVEWNELLVLGDTNQRIFSFSGTERDIFSFIHSRFPGVVEYVDGEDARKTWRIPADTIYLAHMHMQKQKIHIPARGGGKVGDGTDFLNAVKSGGKGMVLVRDRALFPVAEGILQGASIPYIYIEYARYLTDARRAYEKILGGDYSEKDVRVVARWLGIREDERDEELELMGYDVKEIKSTLDVDTVLKELKKDPVKEKILRGEVEPVIISTIHRAKGKEADHVLLVRGSTKLTHLISSTFPEYENPVKYVAHTRHREGFYSSFLPARWKPY